MSTPHPAPPSPRPPGDDHHRGGRRRILGAGATAVLLLALATWFVPSTPSAASPTPTPATLAAALIATLPPTSLSTTAASGVELESGPQLTTAVWGLATAQVAESFHQSVITTVLDAARAKIGSPYSYASAGPSAFDCSGFTRWVWQAAGVDLPHNSGAQWAAVDHIPLDQLQPGDLVFDWGWSGGSPDHVGLYVGDGMMIHAPHGGAVVRYDPVGWWTGATVAAGRVR
jgi:cell wall-associated NlpC family hydrolase